MAKTLQHSEPNPMLRMVAWIAVIHFIVEALIMGTMSGWNLTPEVVRGALLDSTWLTIISSPLIYIVVARPFIQTARDAQSALATELEAREVQARKLEAALADLKGSAAINEALSQRLQRSSQTIADIHERILQQIGADLHDGPAQLLTYCLLRLDKLAPLVESSRNVKDEEEFAFMRSALTDTLSELRGISQGLALPKLSALSLQDAIRAAVSQHQEQTGSRVELSIGQLPDHVTQAVKVCAYRFVQESLSNAYKHAQANGQRVRALAGEQLVVEVSDAGPGLLPSQDEGKGLGLLGMRARIEAIGGRFEIESAPNRGTVLTMRLDIDRVT